MKKLILPKIALAAFTVMAVGCLFTSCKKFNGGSAKESPAPGVVVTTLAGGGVGSPGTVTDPVYGQIGSANGTGTAASFDAPAGVVMDAAGNVYVAEAGNHMIRKITPDGVVSTFVGNTTAGFVNGVGTAAAFSSIQGIAIDAGGNIFVADPGNQAIRKVTPDGTVSTVAGTGVAGANNGPVASATFSAPTGVAVDGAGNLYVADFNNKMIRKISSDGIVSTLAGGTTGRNNEIGYDNGPGASASFTGPDRLAVDASGNVYVSDFKMIRKITPDGTVSTLAGNDSNPGDYSIPKDGKGSDATFGVADSITIDAAGNLYVGDSYSPYTSIRKITADGTVTTLAGGGNGVTTDGIGKNASFGIIRGLAVNPAGNLLYAADYYTSLVRKIVIN